MKTYIVTFLLNGVTKHKILIQAHNLGLAINKAIYRLSQIDKTDYANCKEAEFVVTEFTILDEQGFFVFV